MSRLLFFGVLSVAVFAVAGWSADPPGKAPAPAADISPVQALCKSINCPGVDDNKFTLAEGLELLTKLSGVTFHIDDRAFKEEQVMDVLKTEIASPNPIPPLRAPLVRVLRRILDRIPVPSGATFMIREDHIEITTRQVQSAEVPLEREQIPVKPGAVPHLPAAPGPGGPGGPGGIGPGPFPPGGLPIGPGLGGIGMAGVGPIVEESKKINVALVSVALDRQTLAEAIRQIRIQANASVVLDPALGDKATAPLTITLLNAPLDSALLVLGELADLDFVWLDNIFYVTTREKADKLRAKWPNRRGGATRPVLPPAAAAGM